MTNLEYIIANHKEDLIDILTNTRCWYVDKQDNFYNDCHDIGCFECKFGEHNRPCSINKEEWLNAEHEEPLLFPVGTVVEVPATYDSNTTELRYYWGVYHGLQFCEFFDPHYYPKGR